MESKWEGRMTRERWCADTKNDDIKPMAHCVSPFSQLGE